MNFSPDELGGKERMNSLKIRRYPTAVMRYDKTGRKRCRSVGADYCLDGRQQDGAEEVEKDS